MFLTAQRVLDDAGRQGVGVYAYTHQGTMLAAPTDEANFAHYSEVEPGVCFFAAPAPKVDLQRAWVIGFFDVLAPDSASLQNVLRQLDRGIVFMPRALSTSGLSFWNSNGLTYRFYANPAFAPVRFDEVRRLKDEMRVLMSMTGPIVAPPQPLRVFASRDALGTVLSLDASSRQRVEAATGRPVAGSLHIDQAVWQWQAATISDPYLHYVMALTQLDENGLRALGGAVVVDHERGWDLWRLG